MDWGGAVEEVGCERGEARPARGYWGGVGVLVEEVEIRRET